MQCHEINVRKSLWRKDQPTESDGASERLSENVSVRAGECAKVHTRPLQQPSKEGTREQKCGVWKLPLQSCGAQKYRKCMQTNILCAEGKVYFARKAPWGLVNIQRDPLK